MDNLFSLETQTGIDDLFGSSPSSEPEELVTEEKSIASIKADIVTSDQTSYDVSDDGDIQDLISELFTNVEAVGVSQIVVEDTNDPFYKAFEQFGDLVNNAKAEKELQVEETLIEPQKASTYIDGLADDLSKVIKRTNPKIDSVEEGNLIEQRLQMMQNQLDRLRGIMLENTMVSGIGQGGDGQTPGSGEVRILKMDDVLNGNNISDGDVLVWDQVQGGFIPVASGGLGRDADGSTPIAGEIETTRTVLLEKAAPKMIEVADSSLGRNELWPSQILTQEDANEGFLSFIVELDRIKPTMFVSDNPPPTPDLGDLWFDSALLEMRVWYNDPGSPDEELKWISIMAPGNTGVAAVSDSPPENPSVGQTWFDSHMLELRVWYVPPGTNQEGKWVSAINPSKASIDTGTDTEELNTYTGGAPETTTVVAYGPSEQETTTESVTDTGTNTDTSSSGY